MSDLILSCSERSLAQGEPTMGTAPRVDYWLLLEYTAPFGKKAFEECDLPEAVKAHLVLGLEGVKHGRVQLIRREERVDKGPFHFFAVVNHEEQPNIYEFSLPDYEALLALDIPAILREEPAFWQYDRAEPLYLVCTNGKRDVCCALHGMALYQHLLKNESALGFGSLWQTAHIGGHRFAPALACLPHGAIYGRVPVEDALAICIGHRSGVLTLPYLRGRTCYDGHVQAADHLLRQQTGDLSLAAYKLVEVEAVSGHEWVFHFRERATGRAHCVQLVREVSDVRVLQSCMGAGEEPIQTYQLVDYQSRAALRW